MKYYYIATYAVLTMLLSACGSHPSEPSQFVDVQELPALYPDYMDVTIPSNLAPVNFMVTDAEACIARMDYPGGSLCYGNGNKVQIDADEWKTMQKAAKGGNIQVTLYARQEGKWKRYPAFAIHVAEEEIDPWVSYRLIEPSYVAYEKLDIMQRNLTNFNEEVIVSNHIGQRADQCINCHSYQNYHTENMVYHVRGEGGGTMLTYKGKTRLMTQMKREGMISNPVYPSWHPSLPLIAFSTNSTGQLFHTQDVAKVEVQDTESHLVIYDVERDSMILVPSPKEDFENFPTWSPDGKKIYYTSAYFAQKDTSIHIDRETANLYQDIKYNLYVRDFDPDSLKVGERRLVLDLETEGLSASLPHVSPNGKYLLYACGPFGCFHIWHPEADIRMLNLETMEIDSLSALNSPLQDSYPTWSSNGRWIILASRRDDGNFSRVYIAYFDAEGKAHKAFVVPQKDPEHDKLFLRSYNRPETMVEKVPAGLN